MPQVELEGRPLAIVPCRNKKPCCPGGFHSAVADPDEIAALWSAYSDAPQIGVATGAVPNNLDILDIDLHKGGDKFFKENEHRLPDTRAHRTPSGGLHLLFRHAAGLGISAGRVAEGVDVRADNGGVVWYPAHGLPVHEAPVADWPEWLLVLARPKGGASRSQEDIDKRESDAPTSIGLEPLPTRDLNTRIQSLIDRAGTAPDGNGNSCLFWSACRFGEMIVEGRVTEHVAEFLLKGVIWRNKLPREKSMRTIVSGLQTGIANARYWKGKEKS